MANVLRESGFEVRSARDGAQAMQLLQESAPALLIMDVMMPNLDGWTLRAAMMERPELSRLPVLVVSALEPRGELLEALRPAAALRKPFCLDRLLKHVHHLLNEFH